MEELLNLQTPVCNSLHKSAPMADPAIVYSEEANKLSGLWAFAQAALATGRLFFHCCRWNPTYCCRSSSSASRSIVSSLVTYFSLISFSGTPITLCRTGTNLYAKIPCSEHSIHILHTYPILGKWVNVPSNAHVYYRKANKRPARLRIVFPWDSYSMNKHIECEAGGGQVVG